MPPCLRYAQASLVSCRQYFHVQVFKYLYTLACRMLNFVLSLYNSMELQWRNNFSLLAKILIVVAQGCFLTLEWHGARNFFSCMSECFLCYSVLLALISLPFISKIEVISRGLRGQSPVKITYILRGSVPLLKSLNILGAQPPNILVLALPF